jgi:hypothetical protein
MRLSLRVPHPLRFSMGGWFSIDVLSLMDKIDADRLFSYKL